LQFDDGSTKVRSLVNTYLHLLENCGAIVGDDDLSIWRNEHLVHALGAKGCLQKTGNSSCGKNVDFVSLEALDSLFLTLFAENDERTTRFVES
jgi:hypothetical protein